MRGRIVHAVTALGLALGGIVAISAPAAAYSCADMAWTPEVIVARSEPSFDGQHFFDLYDAAVVGRVSQVTDDPRRQTETVATIDVRAVFGTAEPIPETITAWTADDESGYPFAFMKGRTYFIPIRIEDAEDGTIAPGLCEPITPLRHEDRRRDLIAKIEQQDGGASRLTIGAMALLAGVALVYVLTTPIRSTTGVRAWLRGHNTPSTKR